MSHKKEILTAVGTLAIAVGIGFVMQSSEAAKERYGSDARPLIATQATLPVGDLLDAVSETGVIDVQSIELTSASDTTPISVPRSDATIQRVALPNSDGLEPPTAGDIAPQVDACAVTATAQAQPGALAFVSLSAPCAPNERVAIHHNDLVFTETTDATGTLDITIPALAEEAVFILALSNGDGAVAQVTVPDIGLYSRAALQGHGSAGLHLHAFEFGASFGDAGHKWSGGEAANAAQADGQSGHLIRLGDQQAVDPLIVDIYTFASNRTERDGDIHLSVDAEVTEQNCGEEIHAKALELSHTGETRTRELMLDMPGCDALGDFLVLNILITDMKVASN